MGNNIIAEIKGKLRDYNLSIEPNGKTHFVTDLFDSQIELSIHNHITTLDVNDKIKIIIEKEKE